MQTPMRCFDKLKDSPLNKLSDDLWYHIYGKQLACHEAMDSLVNTHCFLAQHNAAILSIT